MAPVAWMAVFSDAPVLSLNFLESHDDFHRYFNRCLMLLALVGLGLLWRVTKIKSWAELGWTDFPKAKNHISIGLLIGLASLMAIAALGLIFEAREFALLIRLENGVNIGSIHWAPPLPWVCSKKPCFAACSLACCAVI